MSGLTDKHIESILKRQTIGKFVPSELSARFKAIKSSQHQRNPLRQVGIRIGKIDGNVICSAIWSNMSYNPGRFGTNSPFIFNGRNNIYEFCKRPDKSMFGADATEILEQVRYYLVTFLRLNAAPNGAWRDVLYAPSGILNVGITDAGLTDKNYKMLAQLRNAINIVTKQNLDDFRKKRSPYRSQIIDIVNVRHSNDIHSGDNITTPNITAADNNIAEARYDDMIEAAEITLRNANYISSELYNQTFAEYQKLLRIKNFQY